MGICPMDTEDPSPSLAEQVAAADTLTDNAQ